MTQLVVMTEAAAERLGKGARLGRLLWAAIDELQSGTAAPSPEVDE